jgi:ABC-type lipoprotein release transport system permease subunit
MSPLSQKTFNALLIGIAAGVSSLVATAAANEAILRGFRSTLDAVGGTADLVVTGPAVGGLPDELVDPVRAVAGVKSASPAILEVAKLPDGTRVQVFGVDLAAGDTSRGLDAFESGEQMPDPVAFLNDPDAVLVARTLAAERGLKVGDMWEISAEMSAKRAQRDGLDTVKEAFYQKHESENGEKHPDVVRREKVAAANARLAEMGISLKP